MEMAEITIRVDEDDGSDLFREAQKRLSRLGLKVHDATSLTLEVDGNLDNLEVTSESESIEAEPMEAEESVEKSEDVTHSNRTKDSERPAEDEIEDVLDSTEIVTKERVTRDAGDNPYLPVLEVLFSSRDSLRPDQIFELTDGRGKGNLKRMWKNHLVDRQENDDDTGHWHKYSLSSRGHKLVLEIRSEWSEENQLEENMEAILG